jgi:predicted RNase H-like HicB family nuclease
MSEAQRTSTKAAYKAVVHDEAEGGYWAEVPELPGCFTQGETLDALYQNLLEAIACHLDVDMNTVRVGLLEMAVA